MGLTYSSYQLPDHQNQCYHRKMGYLQTRHPQGKEACCDPDETPTKFRGKIHPETGQTQICHPRDQRCDYLTRYQLCRLGKQANLKRGRWLTPQLPDCYQRPCQTHHQQPQYTTPVSYSQLSLMMALILAFVLWGFQEHYSLLNSSGSSHHS